MQTERARSGRVLGCEDNLLIVEGWSAMLRETGYDVAGPTSSAETALEEAQRQLPDFALGDIDLHGAVDGVFSRRRVGTARGPDHFHHRRL